MVHLIIALKGPVVTETVEFLLPGSFSACMLSLARLSGNVLPLWHSQHIIRRYRRCSGVRFCRTICARIKNSPKAASTSAFNVFRFFALSFAVFYIFRPSLASFALSFAVFWVIEWTLQMERALFVCQCLFSQP